MCKRNINQLPLSYTQLGTWTATQVRALTGNQTSNPLVFSLVLNPLGRLSLPSSLTVHFSSPEAFSWEHWLSGGSVEEGNASWNGNRR